MTKSAYISTIYGMMEEPKRDKPSKFFENRIHDGDYDRTDQYRGLGYFYRIENGSCWKVLYAGGNFRDAESQHTLRAIRCGTITRLTLDEINSFGKQPR